MDFVRSHFLQNPYFNETLTPPVLSLRCFYMFFEVLNNFRPVWTRFGKSKLIWTSLTDYEQFQTSSIKNGPKIRSSEQVSKMRPAILNLRASLALKTKIEVRKIGLILHCAKVVNEHLSKSLVFKSYKLIILQCSAASIRWCEVVNTK